MRMYPVQFTSTTMLNARRGDGHTVKPPNESPADAVYRNEHSSYVMSVTALPALSQHGCTPPFAFRKAWPDGGG